jgi:hypothetical protein
MSFSKDDIGSQPVARGFAPAGVQKSPRRGFDGAVEYV